MLIPKFTGLWGFFFHYAVFIKARFIFTLKCSHTPTLSLPGSAAILVEVAQLCRQPRIDEKRLQEQKRARKVCGPHLTGVVNWVALDHIM